MTYSTDPYEAMRQHHRDLDEHGEDDYDEDEDE